ncbi:hypothetical protein [Pseudoduganella violaceinigra]|uniref:hypothetical protein n=1 Tax=Pseudoduganella violaceinigra TaxID=246602 RepID=UPI00048614F6|nr:hypothetical protein [Pseudoduganella violaceinigra]
MVVGRMFVAGLAITLAQGAHAHGGGLWYPMTVSLCLIQDEQYASLPMGKAFSSEEGFVRWKNDLSPDVRACISQAKPVPARLCKALLAPPPNQRQEKEMLDKLYQQYSLDIDSLGEKLGCKR